MSTPPPLPIAPAADRIAALSADLAKPGRIQQLTRLGGSSLALLVAWLSQGRHAPLLWICPDERAAEQRFAELVGFLGREQSQALRLPLWDVRPWSGMSPDAALSRARVEALWSLGEEGERAPVVVASAASLAQRCLAPEALAGAVHRLKVGTDLERKSLLEGLVSGGYLAAHQAAWPGSFAVRGGIIDIWPAGFKLPLRIELWGEEIDSLRTFDPVSQRSVEQLQEVLLLPGREVLLDAPRIRRGRVGLKELADERGLPARVRRPLDAELVAGNTFGGIEFYLPLLEERLVSVAEHLPAGSAVVFDGPLAIREEWERLGDRLLGWWERGEAGRKLAPPPSSLYLDARQLDQAFAGFAQLHHSPVETGRGTPVAFGAEPITGLRGEIVAAHGTEGMLEPLVRRLRGWAREGISVGLSVRSPTRARALVELLEGYQLELLRDDEEEAGLADWFSLPPASEGDGVPLLSLLQSPLSGGFSWPELRLVVLSEEEIFGRRRSGSGAAKKRAGGSRIASFGQLQVGDLVVHRQHGLGRYLGLKTIEVNRAPGELARDRRRRLAEGAHLLDPSGRPERRAASDFLELEYAGGDRLYVPALRLDELTRYRGAGGKGRKDPPLDKLGSASWGRRRAKVKEAVDKLAARLLELYAQRRLAKGLALGAPGQSWREFAATFPYEETPDQLAAIEAVTRDMLSDEPMDRLVCGDVGFGKTEVAMRAALLAVESGTQVVLLVPTTVLALQHYRTLLERFARFPVNIEMMCRLTTKADQKEILKKLKSGGCDIVVGTHRLLNRDVKLRRLGLLVVDEEHRFGVRHKERIKEMREEVHCLTLTATPIPRTLHLALSGLRDLSLIQTPPQGRREVHTRVAPFRAELIRSAIERELSRGGQVFFIHNRVRTIHSMANFIQRLAPKARVRVGHGQLKERELEDIMVDFIERRFEILVCTTIVESGVDVGSANTIVINRADRMGLAQLYQLRGRVGRGDELGSCLLLVPPRRTLHKQAMERLRTLTENTGLGSGYQIAQADLELRGAGNVLGKAQSGHIAAVGYDGYVELLEAAVAQAKRAQGMGRQRTRTELDLRLDAYIPGDYVDDQRDRLLYYKALASAATEEEARTLVAELTDRFGRPPEQVKRLAALVTCRALAGRLGVRRIGRARTGNLVIEFGEETPLRPEQMLGWVSRNPRKLKLRGSALLATPSSEEPDRMIRFLGKILGRLERFTRPASAG